MNPSSSGPNFGECLGLREAIKGARQEILWTTSTTLARHMLPVFVTLRAPTNHALGHGSQRLCESIEALGPHGVDFSQSIDTCRRDVGGEPIARVQERERERGSSFDERHDRAAILVCGGTPFAV
jgi:hypothetical protein